MKLETRSYSPLARMFGGAGAPYRSVELPNGVAHYFEMGQLQADRRNLVGRWARWTADTWKWYVDRISSGRGFGPGLPLMPIVRGGMGVQEGISIRTQLILFQVSLTPASVATIVCAEQALTVTGILASDVLAYASNSVAMATATAAVTGHVSAANTIALGYCNPTAGALTPTPGTYNVLVLRG